MSRKSKVSSEIVLASQGIVIPNQPSANLQAMIEELVRERVDQFLAMQNAQQLEPDFLPNEVAKDVRLRHNLFERRKWPLYFEKWGCRVCEEKKRAHSSTGHCYPCGHRIVCRLGQLKIDFYKASPERDIQKDIDNLTSRIRTAREILGG